MKFKLLSTLLGSALGAATAMAAPLALPSGPMYIQFTTVEQTDVSLKADGTPFNNLNNCPGCNGAPEGLWGVSQVNIMQSVSPSSTSATSGQAAASTGTPSYFVDQALPLGGQITAMFYESTFSTKTLANGGNSFQSTGGYIDLYWDDSTLANTLVNVGGLLPSARTSTSAFAGVTDGVHLARLAFASGSNPLASNGSVTGSVDSPMAMAAGTAYPYSHVVDLNNDGLIDAMDGSWADQLNVDWFGTVFGLRDIRFGNQIQNNTAWNGGQGGSVVAYDQTSDSTGRDLLVPEPTSLALVSLGLLGLGAARRRRND